MSFEPCGYEGPHDGENYTPERVRHLMGGKEFVAPREIHDHPEVDWEDKYWLFCNLLSERGQHELACRVAETSLQYIEDEELLAVARSAIQAKRDWLAGRIDDGELAAAGSAVRAAAWYAAWYADEYAAWYAAWYAADAAASAAARYAAGDADAARSAAWEKFCGIALEMLEC